MAQRPTGFALLYRFDVAPGREEEFVTAWARMTELIRDHQGGRGSRLHRGDDGIFYAYAQWPDRETQGQDLPLPAEADAVREAMEDATVGRWETTRMETVRDYLLPEEDA